MFMARPIVIFAGRKFAVDLPHLAFATGLAGWVAWYCWDAWHANSDVENMILILPVSAAAVLLYVFVIAGSCRRVDQAEKISGSISESLTTRTAIRILGSMVLLAGFVLSGPWIGFDVATFVYMLFMMVFLGERRIPILLLVPLLFTAAVIYAFGTLLSTPLPVLILRGQS